jgi:hypothetical protein
MDAPDHSDSMPSPGSVKPPGVDFQLDFDALTISYRWRSPRHFILLFVCIAWDVASVPLLGTASFDGFHTAALISLVFAILGLGLTYFTLAGFLNRTTITVNLQWLVITHGPIPWGADKCIEIARINQLYAVEPFSRLGGRTSPFGYRLNAVLRDQTKLKLLSGLSSPDMARFVEQSVEEYLHIEDRPVAGELSKY